MVRMRSKNAISIPGQISRLENDFPKGCVIFRSPRNFKWEMDIQPTPNSRIYRIRIRYTIGDRPKVYVIDPPFLEKAEGYSLLPHVYSTTEQQICLYYPRFDEWNDSKFIAKTIVPWASEWLFYYELWLITGEWLGEGIEHGGNHENSIEQKLDGRR